MRIIGGHGLFYSISRLLAAFLDQRSLWNKLRRHMEIVLDGPFTLLFFFHWRLMDTLGACIRLQNQLILIFLQSLTLFREFTHTCRVTLGSCAYFISESLWNRVVSNAKLLTASSQSALEVLTHEIRGFSLSLRDYRGNHTGGSCVENEVLFVAGPPMEHVYTHVHNRQLA